MQLTVYKNEDGVVDQVVAEADSPEDAQALTDFNERYAKAKEEKTKAQTELKTKQTASMEAIANAKANLDKAREAAAAAQAAKADIATAEAAEAEITAAQAKLDDAIKAQNEAAQVTTTVG